MIPLWLFLVRPIPLWLAVSPAATFAADAKPGWQAEWERTLRAAEKEGEVAVAIYDQGPVTVEVVDAFQKAFPKIKVNSLRARGSQIGPKIIAERRAEKYLIDLFTGGKGTDDFRTPYTRWSQTKSPGVEINAITYLNLFRGDWLTEPAPITEFVLVLLAGTLLGFGLIPWRPTLATAIAVAIFLTLALFECLLVWRYRIWFPWLTIGCIQLPTALGWSLLTNVKKLYREKEVLEEKLATAVGDKLTTVLPFPAKPTSAAQTVVVGDAARQVAAPPIPNHEMLRCIGKGAYGEVWLARDEIGTYHAVKVVHRESFSDSGPFDREFGVFKN